MWILNVTRKEFLDLVGGSTSGINEARETKRLELAKPADGDGLVLVWMRAPDSTRQLPSAILVHRNAERDFLAWVSSYVPSFRPFTRYCRVLDPSEAQILADVNERPSLGGVSNACLGLVFSEALVARESKAQTRIAWTAARATFSFAMARALALGIAGPVETLISQRWLGLQRLVPASEPVHYESLREAWRVLVRVASTTPSQLDQPDGGIQPSLVAACKEIKQGGSVSDGIWQRLTESFPALAARPDKSQGTREERVLGFEKTVAQLRSQSRSGPVERAFLCGYLASQIAPGSIEHMGLLSGLLHDFPGVQYWYGLCAGLHRQSELQNFGDGLGRLLVRDLVRGEFRDDSPSADLAAGELAVLMSGDNPVEFLIATPGRLRVEVAPLVVVEIPWMPHGAPTQGELFGLDLRSDETEGLVRRLGDAIHQAEHLYQRLAGGRPRQRSGYPKKGQR